MMKGDRSKRARGVAAVEFALVVPLLLVLVLGTIDWGWYFFVRAVVVNASREGARTGSLYASAAAVAPAEAAARAYLSGSLDASRATELTATVIPGAGATDSVRVRITYPVGSITGFLTPFLPADVVAQAEMRQ